VTRARTPDSARDHLIYLLGFSEHVSAEGYREMSVLWYTEWLSSHEAHIHGILELIFDGRTKYQRVTIAKTGSFGLALFLDGFIQSAEYDEFIYHESLVHPAMITYGNPRKVLIIGGGEGATLREVLKYESVERVVMVDIDEELVNLCKKYLPEWHEGAFDDPRAELVFADGRKFIEETEEKFDVIILDVTDPVKGTPGVLLYTKEFYEKVKERLNPGGVIVTQATSLRYYERVFAVIHNTVASVFPIARRYKVFVPSFYSDWGFVLGSLGRDPLEVPREEVESKLARLSLRFLDAEQFRFLFALPRFLAERLSKYKEISTLSNPVEI